MDDNKNSGYVNYDNVYLLDHQTTYPVSLQVFLQAFEDTSPISYLSLLIQIIINLHIHEYYYNLFNNFIYTYL